MAEGRRGSLGDVRVSDLPLHRVQVDFRVKQVEAVSIANARPDAVRLCRL
jgi:hypothetical protein